MYKLCHTAWSTRQQCSAYASERETYTEKLRSNPVLSDGIKSDLRNPELLTQLTQDASFYVNTNGIEAMGNSSCRSFYLLILSRSISDLSISRY